MTLQDISTERLRLVVMSPAMLEADAKATGELSLLVQANVPAIWPPEHWEPHIFPFLRKQYIETPYTIPWNRYVVLTTDTHAPVLIGNMNGFPRSATEVEVGYSLLAPWQGLGLATEGMQAFIRELLKDNSLQRITAQTLPSLTASIRVLEKCGLEPSGDGDEDGTIRYCLQR